MKILKFGCFLAALAVSQIAHAQCNAEATAIYGVAYAIRSGGTMIHEISAYAVGPDAPFDAFK